MFTAGSEIIPTASVLLFYRFNIKRIKLTFFFFWPIIYTQQSEQGENMFLETYEK